MAAGTHVVVWPRCRVMVNGKSKILDRGDLVPNGVTAVDLENLVSFGAIAGTTGLPEAVVEVEPPAPALVDPVVPVVDPPPVEPVVPDPTPAKRGRASS